MHITSQAYKRTNLSRNNCSGMALVFALLFIMIIATAVTVTTQRVLNERRIADAGVREILLEEACRAGIDLTIEQIWNQYIHGLGNTTGNLSSYRVFIDDIVEHNEDLNYNGTQDGHEYDSNGNGVFDIATPVILIDEDTPYSLPSGGEVIRLTLERTDDLTGTTITIRSTGRVQGHTRTAVQTVRVGGDPFDGFDYAVLANNINCILCHAEFRSLHMHRNEDAQRWGSFDRVKIASLESLMIRPTGSDSAYSNVAGTVYTRGEVYDPKGHSIDQDGLASSTFGGYLFDRTNGKLHQDSQGDMVPTSLVKASLDEDGLPEQFANFYRNYPTETQAMTDGNLPDSFPSPFPNEDGSRTVTASEFSQVMNAANGSISGGVAYGVPHGAAYSDNTLPTASNSAVSDLENGNYEGNLILTGTEDNPIVIDQSVAVNGDLIVQGPIKGEGQLLVRNNVYVTGDVTYADAEGKFGEAADGQTNALAVTAGGSIMMGDYLTIRAKNNEGDDGRWQGRFIDVREPNKTVGMNNGETTEVGYFDDGVVDAGFPQGDEGMFSFTTSELMIFNRMEYLKAQSDSDYVPRYYRLRPSQPIYQYTGNEEHAISYFDPGVELVPDLTDAVIHDLNPSDFWISEDQLREFWYADEMQRTSGPDPFRFDGLLYSNNSVFALTRSKGRHNSNTFGQMIVRGGIVAADLGMLIPGANFNVPRDALRLYYDPRVADFLRVEDTSEVEFRRQIYRNTGRML